MEYWKKLLANSRPLYGIVCTHTNLPWINDNQAQMIKVLFESKKWLKRLDLYYGQHPNTPVLQCSGTVLSIELDLS